METRIDVLDAEIAAAFTVLGDSLKSRLLKHGKKSFIGPHEVLGVIEEEMHELREAVRSNKRKEVIAELLDVGVGAIFGVASLIAMERAEGKPDVPVR
jgi:hypothetical protein